MNPGKRREGFGRRREDQALADVQHAMQEAWLTRHGVSRLVRWLFTMLAATVIAIFVVDAFLVPSERKGCERRQPIFRELETSLDEVADNSFKRATVLQKGLPKTQGEYDLAVLYGIRYSIRAYRIERLIVKDCNEAYDHIPPFDWFFD